MDKSLIFIALLLIAVGTAEQYGESRVQHKWDQHNLEVKGKLALEKQRSDAERIKLIEDHKKEIEYAKSKAGADAISRFLREHGLLPNGAPVHRPDDSVGEAEVPEGTDGAASKFGAGESLEEFATRCGIDAIKVELCTEWAIKEGLEVVQ